MRKEPIARFLTIFTFFLFFNCDPTKRHGIFFADVLDMSVSSFQKITIRSPSDVTILYCPGSLAKLVTYVSSGRKDCVRLAVWNTAACREIARNLENLRCVNVICGLFAGVCLAFVFLDVLLFSSVRILNKKNYPKRHQNNDALD